MNFRKAAAAVSLALTAAGFVYGTAEIVAMRRFRKELRNAPAAQETPPITIFKPLCGSEPCLYENLRSFCTQNYPKYQVIFGARDPADPALEIARGLLLEFPEADLTIVAGHDTGALPNPKIANVAAMMPAARHDLLAIVDSDIRVGPEYLRAIASAFQNERTGAATCLYGAVPEKGLAAETGAAIVNEHFMASTLVARLIEPLGYCFGATMAVRRSVLEEIGGMPALGSSIADDFKLGHYVAAAGYDVALCPYVVRMTSADRDLGELWLHHLRWQRTVRSERPRGFAGEFITFILPLSLVSALLSPSLPVAGAVLGAGIALRKTIAEEARATFVPESSSKPWLIPITDAIAAATWLATFFGSRVTWRGQDYELQAGGRMVR